MYTISKYKFDFPHSSKQNPFAPIPTCKIMPEVPRLANLLRAVNNRPRRLFAFAGLYGQKKQSREANESLKLYWSNSAVLRYIYQGSCQLIFIYIRLQWFLEFRKGIFKLNIKKSNYPVRGCRSQDGCICTMQYQRKEGPLFGDHWVFCLDHGIMGLKSYQLPIKDVILQTCAHPGPS